MIFGYYWSLRKRRTTQNKSQILPKQVHRPQKNTFGMVQWFQTVQILNFWIKQNNLSHKQEPGQACDCYVWVQPSMSAGDKTHFPGKWSEEQGKRGRRWGRVGAFLSAAPHNADNGLVALAILNQVKAWAHGELPEEWCARDPYVKLTHAEVIWKEGTSVKKMPPSEKPVRHCVN
jgi:hypothetical protein